VTKEFVVFPASVSGATRAHDFGDGHPIEQVEYELTLG
jgi:hypothetical protein